MPADPVAPVVVDELVYCAGKCERQFTSYRWRMVHVHGVETRVLVDRDGFVIYDMVLVCSCGSVFHHHTKDETLRRHAEAYRETVSAYEKLMKHYEKRGDGGAIITGDNLTG
jgi:hypothetical protein